MSCPKRMLNGPCGGYNGVFCEDSSIECVWIKAFNNLKIYGREKDMFRLKLDSFFMIRDHRPSIRSLRDFLRSRGFKYFLIYEYVPRRDLSTEKLREDLEKIYRVYEGVDFVDNPGGRPLQSSIALASITKTLFPDKHVGFQITGRDHTRDMIATYIITALSFGIDSIIATTGDLKLGVQSKSVWDLDSPRIIYLAKLINDLGRDHMRRRVYTGTNKIFIGASVNPYLNPLEPEIYKISVKRDAGADFFVTQPIYDVDILRVFLSGIRRLLLIDPREIDIVIGLGSISSKEIARFLFERSHVKIPQGIREALENENKEALEEENIRFVRNLTRNIIREYPENPPIFYISTFGEVDLGVKIGELVRDEIRTII
ncbi:MAG: methylenetetrahydrofolate reductase C-terminal domain-containing protein [Sulfolobales archaeon]